MKHFEKGAYSINAKFLRRRRHAIGLLRTTMTVIESLFGYIGKDLKVRPSQATIARECGVSEDTVGWHIRYLRAQGYLPTEPQKMTDGTVRNVYDLTPLRDFNQRVHEAVKSKQPPLTMFTKSFTEWRDEEREKQKGGRRGRRRGTANALAPTPTPSVPSDQDIHFDDADGEQYLTVLRDLHAEFPPEALEPMDAAGTATVEDEVEHAPNGLEGLPGDLDSATVQAIGDAALDDVPLPENFLSVQRALASIDEPVPVSSLAEVLMKNETLTGVAREDIEFRINRDLDDHNTREYAGEKFFVPERYTEREMHFVRWCKSAEDAQRKFAPPYKPLWFDPGKVNVELRG